MRGTHTVVVERAKVKYTLTFKRNISFIRGNSGTGKTTLISMIRDYNDRGPESGVKLSCDVPCETLSGSRQQTIINHATYKVVFNNNTSVLRRYLYVGSAHALHVFG